MLVLEANRVVPLERIVDQLWDDRPPSSAAGSVHSTISILRRRLEPGRARHARPTLIQSRSPGYVLQIEARSIDAVRFEEMAAQAVASSDVDPTGRLRLFDAALGLWRGPALADFAGQRWAMAAAVRLDGLRSATVEHRIDALLAAGGHLDAIADSEAMITDDPLRERPWAQLMTALYRSGRQVDALRAFQSARRALADVGIEPGRELRDLEARVVGQALDEEPAPGSEPARASIDRVEALCCGGSRVCVRGGPVRRTRRRARRSRRGVRGSAARRRDRVVDQRCCRVGQVVAGRRCRRSPCRARPVHRRRWLRGGRHRSRAVAVDERRVGSRLDRRTLRIDVGHWPIDGQRGIGRRLTGQRWRRSSRWPRCDR